jgi:hypothetical protein
MPSMIVPPITAYTTMYIMWREVVPMGMMNVWRI